MLLEDTCFILPWWHFSLVTYLLCHYIKGIINSWYLSWVHKVCHRTKGGFLPLSPTCACFLSAEVQPSITSRWQLPFSTWSHIRWITGWIWLSCEADIQKEGTLGALMPHQGGQQHIRVMRLLLSTVTVDTNMDAGWILYCRWGQKRKELVVQLV